MGVLNAVILLPLALTPALAATASLKPDATILTPAEDPLSPPTNADTPAAPSTTVTLDACSKCSIRRCLSMWEWVPDIQADPAFIFDPNEGSSLNFKRQFPNRNNRNLPWWRSPSRNRRPQGPRPGTSPPPPAITTSPPETIEPPPAAIEPPPAAIEPPPAAVEPPPATTSGPPRFMVPAPPLTTALPEGNGGTTPYYTETFVAYRIVTAGAMATSVELNTSPPEWFTPPPTNAATTHVERASYTDGAATLSVELAYPTPMIVLEDSYPVYGTQLKRDSVTGESSCVDFEIDVEVDPMSAIKPGLEVGEVDQSDPLGWGYKLVMMDYLCDRGWEFFNVMETPPQVEEIPESLLQECVMDRYYPHTGGQFSSRWRRVGGG